MTGSAPQPGDTHTSTRNPWHAPGPDGTWWHGDPPPADAPDRPTAEQAAVTRVEPPAENGSGAAPAPEAASKPDAPYEPEPVAVPNPTPPVDDQPFWMPSSEIPHDPGTAWPAPQMRAGRGYRPGPAPAGGRGERREPRRPAVALTALVLLSLVATFFAWVSAGPLWLALGHGDRGTATVFRCTGTGVGQRCVGEFAAADGGFTAERVALLGVAEHERREGAAVSASMVDRNSRQAYVGTDGLALHLRWGLGLALVLLCGAGIVWATGATRLESRRARRWAVLGSLGGPLLMMLGFLAAAF